MVIQALALAAYAGVMRLLAPFLLVKLWRRGAEEPLYRHAWRERFGWYAQECHAREPERPVVQPHPSLAPDAAPWIWVHAVSLGETRAASALIHALREALPNTRLLLTHGTATGREAGAALLRPGDLQVWAPFDTPGATRRFLARFRPRVGVLMETEIWPQLLAQAQRAQVPMVLANARLSERSLRQGQRLAWLMRPAAARLTLVLAQTEADAQRLKQAGAPLVQVCGNLKFDMAPRPDQIDAGRAWRQALGRPVMLAASTREGEEEPLLRAWQAMCGKRLGADASRWPLLLLVPRHPQRFDEVAAMVQATGLQLARRSSARAQPGVLNEPANPVGVLVSVLLGDSLGEMALYYSASDVALLGGSFAPLGGQNLIEAAACGCPIIVGPHTFNFEQATHWALAAGAAWRVPDFAAAIDFALGLIASESGAVLPEIPPEMPPAGPPATVRLQEARRSAVAFAQSHRGAAHRMARLIGERLFPAVVVRGDDSGGGAIASIGSQDRL